MKVAILFSGGKDSTFTLHVMHAKGFKVTNLIIISPKSWESWMFHKPNINWATLQAKAMEIPYIYLETSGEKDKELKDLERAICLSIEKYDIDAVAIGAICSNYQRKNVEFICEKLGIKLFTPLWGKDQEKYLLEVIDLGIKFIISSITCYGLPLDYLGKVITKEDAKKIIELSRKYKFNPSFEGGEAETFVIDAPLFKKRIKILDAEKRIVSEYEGYYLIKTAILEEKNV